MRDASRETRAEGEGQKPRLFSQLATLISLLASLLYGISWFLPVAKGGSRYGEGTLPGWEALRVALSPLWSYREFVAGGSLHSSVSVASGLTNVLFVAALVALVQQRRGVRSIRWIGAALLLAVVINAQWLMISPVALELGYYCWLASFVLLAVGMLARLAPRPRRRARNDST
jgi:hypothetical protein